MAEKEQTSSKKKYVVVTAIDCDGLKGKPHIGKGKPVPDGLDPKDIEALLDSGDIKEA